MRPRYTPLYMLIVVMLIAISVNTCRRCQGQKIGFERDKENARVVGEAARKIKNATDTLVNEFKKGYNARQQD